METQDQDDSLYEHYAFTADSGQQPLRVDKFLMNRIENATRNKIQQAAKAGSVHVNDLAVKSNYKVKGGDKVQVLFAHPPYENLLVGEEIPLDIVYEDDALVVVNKADGDTLQAAEQAQQVLAQNLSFVRAQEVPEVLLTSAETGQGIEVLWQSIQQFLSHHTVEQLQSRRQQRYGQLWQQNVPTFLWQALSIDPERAQLLEQAQSKVMTGLCAPLSAARELYVNLFAPPKV